jgi:hypothetical protein
LHALAPAAYTAAPVRTDARLRTEALLADRLSAVVLDALSRAARAPDGTPLIGARKAPGLFPASALGRQAADYACREGWLAPRPANAAHPTNYVITERGLAYLLEEVSPRQILDDVARAMEARGSQIAELIGVTASVQAEWQGMQRLVGSLKTLLEAGSGPPLSTELADLNDALAEWQGAGDCPLPELFHRIRAMHSSITIGRFHDHLRRMHDEGAIYLHPWTGPLYALPEPSFALLVGHEVAYYASVRSDKRLAKSETPKEIGLRKCAPNESAVF